MIFYHFGVTQQGICPEGLIWSHLILGHYCFTVWNTPNEFDAGKIEEAETESKLQLSIPSCDVLCMVWFTHTWNSNNILDNSYLI